MNVVDIFLSLSCRPEFNAIIKDAISTRVKADVNLLVLHVAGEMNSIANAISRADFNRAETLSPNISFYNFTPPSPYKNATLPKPPRSSLGAAKKLI